MLFKPRSERSGMMVSGIIQDNYHLAAFAASGNKVAKKPQKTLCAKFFSALTAKAAIGHAYGPKYGDTLAGGCV